MVGQPTVIQILLKVIIITLGNFIMGYGLAYFSITQNTMVYVLELDRRYRKSLQSENRAIIFGFLNSLMPIGAAIGSIVSSKIAHQLSYRTTFMISDLICILASLQCMYPSFSTLAIERLALGFIIGINSALDSQYIHQIIQGKQEGFFGSLAAVLMLIGLTIGFAFQWIVLKDNPDIYGQITVGILGFNSWRFMFIFPALPAFIRLIAFLLFYTQPTPQEALEHQNKIQAYELLANTYQGSLLDNELDKLQKEIDKEHQYISWSTLFTSKQYKLKMITCILFSLLNQWAGINAVNFYSTVVLGELTDNDNTYMNLANLVNGLLSITSGFFGGFIINQYGKRVTLLVGNGVCAISLTIVTTLQFLIEKVEAPYKLQVFAVFFLFMYIVAYSFSLGSIFWLYLPEQIPSKGIGLVVFINWISLALLAQIFPIVADSLDVYYNFGFFFAIVCILGELMIYFLIEEKRKRKRKPKSEIHDFILSSAHLQQK